jgi:hypothetical protein
MIAQVVSLPETVRRVYAIQSRESIFSQDPWYDAMLESTRVAELHALGRHVLFGT